MNCPICRFINTFSVTNNMGRILWNCYKVSCTVSGSSRVKLSVDDIKHTFCNKKVAADNFSMPTSCVKVNDKKLALDFLHKYGLVSLSNELLYDVKESRLIFPISHQGKVVDANFTIPDPTSPTATLNPVGGVTNYEHEAKINEDKRNLTILRPEYLELFLSDMKRIMSYSKSSQFVNNRVVRTENTRNTDPN